MFDQFRAYYNFEPRFCNRGAGHEKGGVEGLVGFSRRNYMVPVPEAEDLEALNEKLLQECLAYGDHTISGRQDSVNELFEAEKSHLVSLPETPFSNVDSVCTKADKFATVLIDKNRYSVPTDYAHFKVSVVMDIGHVEVFYRNQKIACHKRLYGNNKCLCPAGVDIYDRYLVYKRDYCHRKWYTVEYGSKLCTCR